MMIFWHNLKNNNLRVTYKGKELKTIVTKGKWL